MSEEILTAPVVEGSGTETPAQVADPQAQAPDQGQDTTLESGRTQDKPTSNGETRKPKASEFYGERAQYRKRFEEQGKLISELQAKIDSLAKPASPSPKTLDFDPQAFFTDPRPVLQKIRDEMRQEIASEFKKDLLEKELPQFLSERDKTNEFVRKTQEGFDLLFPKTGTDDKRTPEERAVADPERLAKVDSIIKQYHLEGLTRTNPMESAELVQKLLNLEKPSAPPKNPNAIKKTLVGSTATGSPINAGGKTMATLTEIKAQLDALDKQVDKDPDVRYTPEYVAKNKELQNQLVVLYKELEK